MIQNCLVRGTDLNWMVILQNCQQCVHQLVLVVQRQLFGFQRQIVSSLENKCKSKLALRGSLEAVVFVVSGSCLSLSDIAVILKCIT